MEENQVKIQEGWKSNELGKLIIERKKSGLKVSDATNFGQYPFFTSGETILDHNEKQIDGENIYLATGGVANIKYFKGDAAYSTDTYAVSTGNEIETKYLYFDILNIIEYVNTNYFQGSGLKHLQKKDFKNHIILYPENPTEQIQIATILSKVDEAIVQTEQLIAKYSHIKNGLMQDLLTKGIDENGNIRSEETHEFKDSQLGRIPKEWEVKKLVDLCDHIVDCPHSTPNYINEGILIARTQNIKNGQYLIETSSYVSKAEYKERVARLAPLPGDVIFTREAPIGEAFVIPRGMQICLGQRVMLFRTNKLSLNSEFLVELIYSENVKILFDNMVGGTTVSHLNVKDVKDFSFVKPPVKEQEMIIKYLNKSKYTINSLVVQLSKLQSLKTGLMQDLLSGKVRVNHLIKETASV